MLNELKNYQGKIYPLIDKKLLEQEPYVFDFSENNQDLIKINIDNDQEFSDCVSKTVKENNACWGLGKYNENRTVYRNSSLFNNGEEEERTVHLGYDLWLTPGTPIYSPLSARVHSFAYNKAYRDYGHTIILEHEINGLNFYTLYGHLQKNSLTGLREEQKIEAGQNFCWVGDLADNGQWPPHLHFQIITDMLGYRGDFPGVAKLSEREKYLNICPDPNLLFKY
ncbi:MAG: peptidoglycan DD-metalloendopeptidase family protein [Patescibacteria group bacterium]|nr:peptidoglycan DD-metalloendopeptidase family protein [Patescibacteria group bacterium]